MQRAQSTANWLRKINLSPFFLALRNASDQFFEWTKEEVEAEQASEAAEQTSVMKDDSVPAKPATKAAGPQPKPKQQPKFVVQAVSLLTADTSEGKVGLSKLGEYLKRTDPGFSPKNYGHSSLLNMLKAYGQLKLKQGAGAGWYVSLANAKGG